MAGSRNCKHRPRRCADAPFIVRRYVSFAKAVQERNLLTAGVWIVAVRCAARLFPSCLVFVSRKNETARGRFRLDAHRNRRGMRSYGPL